MLLERLKKENPDREHKPNSRAIVERIIDGIYTKGTYIDPTKSLNLKTSITTKDDDLGYQELDSKYVLFFSYNETHNEFGITYFDLHTLEFCIGQFQDDEMKTKFRTLITRIRPVEVVCDSKFKQSEMIKMLRSSPIPPSFFYVPSADILDFRDSVHIIEHYLSSESSRLPKMLQKMVEDINDHKPSVSSLGNVIKYLESLHIVEKTAPLASFYQYTHEGMSDGKNILKRSTMILDAQVLENLEIFEIQSKDATLTQGSLFSFIDK